MIAMSLFHCSFSSRIWLSSFMFPCGSFLISIDLSYIVTASIQWLDILEISLTLHSYENFLCTLMQQYLVHLSIENFNQVCLNVDSVNHQSTGKTNELQVYCDIKVNLIILINIIIILPFATRKVVLIKKNQ